MRLQIASALDILPTALDAAGLSNSGKEELDGMSLLPALRSEKDPELNRTLYWAGSHYEGEASRTTKGGHDNPPPAWAVRRGPCLPCSPSYPAAPRNALMSTAQPRNLPAAVKARLLTLAEQRGESFNLLQVRFGVERLLYRLSQSRHADRFLLKGAMLFALWDERAPRPTQDVDFLAFGSTELDDIAALFREIVETPVIADGLDFQPDSIRVEQIREADAYGGVRVRLLALLGKGEITLQIDLGSGDVVTPAAERLPSRRCSISRHRRFAPIPSTPWWRRSSKPWSNSESRTAG